MTLPRSSRIAADDRAHELHGRRGEILAFLLDRIVDTQQLVEAERRAHRRDLRAVAGGARDVIEKVVEQLDRRVLRIAAFALRVELQDFAVGQTQQAFDRDAGFEAAFAQASMMRTDDPPELEHRLPRGHLLDLVRDGFEDLEILFGTFAADPADEAQLEARAQAARPLRDRQGVFAGSRARQARPADRT